MTSTFANLDDAIKTHHPSPDLVHHIHEVGGQIAKAGHHHESNVQLVHTIGNYGKFSMLDDVFELFKAAIHIRQAQRHTAAVALLLHLLYRLNYQSMAFQSRDKMTEADKLAHIQTRNRAYSFLYQGNIEWLTGELSAQVDAMSIDEVMSIDSLPESEALGVLFRVLPPNDLRGLITRLMHGQPGPPEGWAARRKLVLSKIPAWVPVLKRLYEK